MKHNHFENPPFVSGAIALSGAVSLGMVLASCQTTTPPIDTALSAAPESTPTASSSTDTNFLPNPKPTIPPGANSAEFKAEQIVNALTFGQQSQMMKNKKFAPSLNDLLKAQDIKVYSIPEYKFHVAYATDETVLVSAIPKQPGTRSFASLVFANKDKISGLYEPKAIICATETPSQKRPELEELIKSPPYQAKCPTGSVETKTSERLRKL